MHSRGTVQRLVSARLLPCCPIWIQPAGRGKAHLRDHHHDHKRTLYLHTFKLSYKGNVEQRCVTDGAFSFDVDDDLGKDLSVPRGRIL